MLRIMLYWFVPFIPRSFSSPAVLACSAAESVVCLSRSLNDKIEIRDMLL
jgi:hypothetical protein